MKSLMTEQVLQQQCIEMKFITFENHSTLDIKAITFLSLTLL